MGHKCVRCGNIYSDIDKSILRGCTSCGSIFFFYLKDEQDSNEFNSIKEQLKEQHTTLENEVTRKIMEERKTEISRVAKKPSKSFVRRKLPLETIEMPQEGIYKINLEALMQKKPLVILERGDVYLIHLSSAFENLKK